MLDVVGINQKEMRSVLAQLGVKEPPVKDLDRSYYSSETWTLPKSGISVTFSGPEIGPLETVFPFNWMMAPIRRLLWPRAAVVDSLTFFGVPTEGLEAYEPCPVPGISWGMPLAQVVEKLGTPTYTAESYAQAKSLSLTPDTLPWIRYDESGKALHLTFDSRAMSLTEIRFIKVY